MRAMKELGAGGVVTLRECGEGRGGNGVHIAASLKRWGPRGLQSSSRWLETGMLCSPRPRQLQGEHLRWGCASQTVNRPHAILPTTTHAGSLRVWEKPDTGGPRPAFRLDGAVPFRKTQGPVERPGWTHTFKSTHSDWGLNRPTRQVRDNQAW